MKLHSIAFATLAFAVSTTVASAEGKLSIYNWGNYTSPELITKFEKEYDVDVTITDFDSNDTALAKIRQGYTGFDVVVPSQSFMPIYIGEGLIAETNPGQMENGKNIAEDWANPDFDPGRKYSVPWLWYTSGVTVNTEDYDGDVNTWGLLLDPPDSLKGKINIVPEMNDIMYAAIRYSGGDWCSNDKALLKKVHTLLKDAKQYWASIDYSGIEKIGTGDIAASLDWSGSALKRRLGNPKIAFGFPKEGFTYGSDNIVVLKDAPNMENAKLFQNFLMDPENAALNSAYTRYPAAIEGAEDFYPDDMKGAPELSIPEAVRSNGELLRLCDPDTTALYGRIWLDIQK